MHLIKNKERIRSTLNFLEKYSYKPKDNDKFTITENQYIMVKNKSSKIQKCALCGDFFILGQPFDSLYCKDSLNKLHVGNIYGEIKTQTIASVMFDFQFVPNHNYVSHIVMVYNSPQKIIFEDIDNLEKRDGMKEKALDLGYERSKLDIYKSNIVIKTLKKRNTYV